MIKILFICHGNICRSPMAEFIMKDMVASEGLSDRILIESAATSREEIGNDIYPPAKRELSYRKVPFERHFARQATASDYDNYDFILCMERYNIANIKRIMPRDPEGKIRLLLDFSDNPRDISDPWYTGDFGRAYDDIKEGCEGLLSRLKAQV